MIRSTLKQVLQSPIFVSSALLVSTIAYLSVAGGHPFFTRGEAREALVVQAMVNQDNLILPLRNGDTIPSKPPLFHWLGYAGTLVNGDLSEWAIRTPSILAAAFTLACFYLLFSRRMSRESAFLSVLILFTSMDFLRTASAARVDMVFSLWVSLATWLLFEAVETRQRSESNRFFLASAVCMGLAALTKGPAGIVLPIAVIGLYSIAHRSRHNLRVTPFVLVIAIASAIALPWYFAAYNQGGRHFLDVHLMRENAARIVGMSDYEVGHESSGISIFGLILLGLLPWSIFLPLIISSTWKLRGGLYKENRTLLFCLVWALFYLVFFALTTSRRNVYLLPSYPAYAYIFGTTLSAITVPGSRLLRAAGWCCAIFAAVLSIAILLVISLRWIDVRHLLLDWNANAGALDVASHLSTLEMPYLCLLMLTVSAFAVAAERIFSRNIRSAAGFLAMAQLLFAGVMYAGIMSKISSSQSPKAELPHLMQQIASNASLYQYQHDLYAVDFYANRNIQTVTSKPQVKEGQSAYIFVGENELREAQTMLGSSEIVAQSAGPIVNGKEKLLILKLIPQTNPNTIVASIQ